MSQLALSLIQENKQNKASFLDLGNCGLENTLPPELADCTWLEGLNLGSNYMDLTKGVYVHSPNKDAGNQIDGTDLLVLKGLTCLQRLHLSHIGLKEIGFLCGLKQLMILYLPFNRIKDISPLHDLTLLTILHLEHNQITTITPLRHLVNLLHLDLSNNKLTDISALQKIVKLTYLSLDENEITSLEPIRTAIHLKLLHFESNKIADLRPLRKMTDLISLKMLSNPLENTDVLQRLIHLEYLSLFSNNTNVLEGMQHLKRLYPHFTGPLSLNPLRNCVHLTDLLLFGFFDRQRLDLAPLAKLVRLERLHVINTLANDIRPLSHLTQLNYLSLLGNEVCDLQLLFLLINLKYLDLTHNKITYLKEELFQVLTHLDQLNVTNNPIANIPQQILQTNNALPAIKNYFQTKTKGVVPAYEAKLILAGNGTVGKTSLLRRWLDNVFDPQEPSTHGIQFRQRLFPELARYHQLDNILLNIWDFGGQDIYHASHRFFMRTQALFLLVWDHQTEQTPEQTEILPDGRRLVFYNHPLLYWLSYIKKLSNDCPVILVQTKRGRDGRQLPPVLPAALQEYNVCHVLSVECSEDLANGFPSLEEAVQEIIVQQIHSHSTQLPLAWYSVRQQLAALQVMNRLLSLNQFEQLCQQQGLNQLSASILLEYFHNAGIAFYRKGLLQDQLILDQEWIIGAFYRLFDRQGPSLPWHYKGYITGRHLQEVWSMYAASEQELFVTFLKECEIGIETYSEGSGYEFENRQFILPQLLPDQRPEMLSFIFAPGEGLYFKYRYPFLSYAVVQRFIVRVGHLAHLKEMWKGGILIKHAEGTVLVEAFPDKNEVIVRLKEKRQTAFLDMIRQQMKQINWDQHGIEELLSLDGQHFILMDNVQQAAIRNPMTQADNGNWVPSSPYQPFMTLTEPNAADPQRLTSAILPSHPGRKDVFICHASEDKSSIVEPLVQVLTTNGITVWYDKTEIAWGDSIPHAINEGLKNSRFVIVIISRHFLKKSWPQREMNAALHLEISFGDKKVLPIIVGTRLERSRLLKQFPLQNDKFFLTWNNSTQEIVDALERILKE